MFQTGSGGARHQTLIGPLHSAIDLGLHEKLRGLADSDAPGSFGNRNRARRFDAFEQLFASVATGLDRPVTILDVGGTNSFWQQRGWTDRDDVTITTANLEKEEKVFANVEPRVLDATDMKEFADGSFDIVFSNSVIEHLRTLDAQKKMAAEVRRLGRQYWVQTPNYWFPIEPHFLTPGWQYLPVSVRVQLLRRRRWGWRGPCPDPAEARTLVTEIRLLKKKEMRTLFPDADLVEERFAGLIKSFVAVRRRRS
jgi:Methyltransferase domain